MFSRRRFLEVTALASTLSPRIATPAVAQDSPTSGRDRPRSGPVAIASGNGLRGVEKAVGLMAKGTDTLDAAVAGVEIQELDPDDQSVGLGGLPNEDGVVQLDASCMHGPTRRAGAVAALEGVATAARVAKAVLEYTDHVLLVGPGARRFALDLGFEERELLTEKSRQAWLRWKANLNPDDDWLDHDGPVDIGPAADPADSTRGTINLCALDGQGDLSSVTTTSGLSWKIPGRVGDSPIVGAGQYCDNRVGAAGATGRGEAAIQSCGSFLIVELMRSGKTPTEACLAALRRAVEMSETRLKTDDGRPLFGLTFYALAKDGRYGSATMYQRSEEDYAKGRGHFAVADASGARLERPAFLYPADRSPWG